MDRQALARATEGTDAPTPGYLYVDLAKAAASSPTACQEMAVYLTRRLQSKSNPNIKYKCCKVIAKLCEQVPRNQFRRVLAQQPGSVAAIKEAMNFRGVPDPVRGDEPNQRVRVAAKEALDAVYTETPTSELAASSTGSYGGIPNSYGPSPHAAGGPAYAGAGGSGRRMEGIGNPRYSDPRLDPRYNGSQPTVKDAIREAGEVVINMIKDPLARNVDVGPPRQGHSGNLPGYSNPGSYGRPPPGASELSRQTGGQWTMASNRGPGSVMNATYYQGRDSSYEWTKSGGQPTSATSGGVGGSWGAANAAGSSHSTPSITINAAPATSTGGAAVSDGTYEKNLVLELCPPGGMKPVPPPDKLASFARAVASLNSDLICPVLLDCIEEGQPWIIRAKALCVMETCLQAGAKPDGSNPYRDFFYACQEEIIPLSAHPRSAVKDPAKRVLHLMGIDAASQPITAPPAAAPPNLLDFDDGEVPVPPAHAPPPPPSEAPPAPPVPASAPMSNSSLFGGMQVKGSAGAPHEPAPQNPPVTAAPSATGHPPVQAPTPTMNLLDFTNSDNEPVASSPAGGDIFGSIGGNEAANSTVSPTDMFAALSVKDSTDKKLETVEMPVTNGGSAFGFINETAPTVSQESGVGTMQNSFDPLKNTTPNSANQQRKVMTLSPEQMQAMAYQQMMMQQHMQMAMAMQRGQPMMPMYPGLAAMPPPVMPPVAMPRVAPGGGAAAPVGFSFMEAPKPAKKDDKKFDFVKDAMQTETKKK